MQTEIARTEKRNRNLRNQIDRIEHNIKESENTFIQASKAFKWEWVEPVHTQEPKGKDRLFRLIYYCE
jgi:hypothetical protein